MTEQEPLKVKISGPVETATPDPWRTFGDYQQDQKEARERHTMFQEQHKLLQKSFRANIIAVAAAIIAALSACFMAYLSFSR